GMSYAELDQTSDRLTAGLVRDGVQPGEVVGLALERGPQAIVAIIGLAKAGCAYLPLDPGFPPELAARLLADCQSVRVVADAAGRARLAGLGLGAGLLALEELPCDDPPPADPPGAEAPAYVMFTSGTTGQPKGVMVPQRAVVRLAVNADFLPLTPDDGMAQAAPLGFDASTLEIWAPLLSGARVCVLDDEDLMDPKVLATRLSDLQVNVMWLTASLLNRLVEEDPACLRPLRRLLAGGEALSPPHLRRLRAACPELAIINGYGPTENTTFTTTHAVSSDDLTAEAVPIGRPIANTRAYCLDRLGNPAPIGVWGELHAAGDGLALGYAGRPDLTREAFVLAGWRPDERLYRTSDLARWREDGVLIFGGRRDGQIKVRGHRVETAAVESALRTLPGVAEAVVMALGRGADRILAAAVAAPRDEQEAWRAILGRTLPDYMIPERFLVLPRLPMTPSGKTDRRALAALLAQSAPGRAEHRQPTTPNQRLLAELWAGLFPGADLDLDSDFIALGGHSLLAMRLAGMLERRTGQRPAVRALLAARRLEAMASLLDSTPTSDITDASLEIRPATGPDYSLSSGQVRLWMLARLHPDSAAYNVPLVLDLTGELNLDALQTALTGLEERQHALRLRMVPAPDDPDGVRMRLAPPGGLVLERIDCTGDSDPESQATGLLEAQVVRPIRLESESPVRAFIYQLGPQRWRLLLVLHHAVCDAWSLPLLWRDLGWFYARALGLSKPELPPLVRNYEDFAAWQRAHLASPAGRALLERWRERLTPLPEPLALPLDRPRPPVRGFRGGFVETAFTPQTSQAIWALAAKQGATPFALLLALLQVLLWRHTGQTDLALGSLVAGRDRAVLADLVGFFVNTLVLRQRIDPSASLRAHLTTTMTTLLEAIVDQDCPFEALVEAAGAPRDTSRNPLFEVLAVWQDGTIPTLELPGLRVTSKDAPFPFAKFDLGFYFVHRADAIGVQVEYDRDLFDRASVEAMLERYRHLLDQALADPDRPLSALEVMSPAERHLVVEGFNATGRDLFSQRTIPEPLLAQCAADPEAAAVLWGAETLSYQAFVARAAGVAAWLQAHGVTPGQVVALCARRSPEMLVGIHGILLAGGAYAPLDPDHPQARRVDMLEDLGDPLILASAETTGLFAGRRVLTLDGIQTAPPAPPPSQPHDLAYVIFTSGSTGRPKGAMIEHHSALNRILWMQEAFPLGPGDVILHKTPITFDVSVWELFWWSWVGAAVALAPPGAERDPRALVEAVARHRVTVMHFVPSMLAEFLAHLESGREDPARLASLRYVFASGEALDAGLVERFNRLLHEPLGVELHNLYGPTEAAVDVSWQPCSPWTGGAVVPIGRPIANTRLYVLDPELRPVPVGVAGEICIGGVQVGRGYVNRPELTAERFLPDPFVPGGRIYRTGDLGRWRRDGVIEYLGRSDHQVKVRGHRIELAEIEHALESHPGVERAVVTPVQAHGLVELHAHLLGAADLTSAGLRQHLRQSLPEYMLPARFLRLHHLPLTSSGKVDRKALDGAPLDHAAARMENVSPWEAEVMAVWREVLPEAGLDAHRGFFESGGNSLLLIRLHERLEARWPGVFSLAELFGRPSVADQAALLAGVLPAPATALQTQAGPVAIVGLAVRLPGAEDLPSFWRDLAAG
ncbi:MAG: amino acid adenylation domain-containing protein, partial [Desulfarculus sp.]|nr:amino acid adenylation domain-containing protein [Desulfarculus sp.]